MSLETAVQIVRDELDALTEQGLPPGIHVRLTGTADALSKAWSAMSGQVALALLVVYLLMAMLFESLVFPLIILLTVPVAAAGGVVGLAALNGLRHQPLDILTLLGFIILIGTAVNNAILIVHQTLVNVRSLGMSPHAAILLAVQERIRPIFLSTITSVVGLLPLVFLPGAGSEIYRGLGAVVLGGLMLSAILTLVVTPPLLAIAAPLMGPTRSDPKVPSL
jgi:HAE1 family hydrophobic/amphiphilic exporter-1